MSDFVKGIFLNKPHPNAPDFVKCKVSIKASDLCQWLRDNQDKLNNGYINLDGKESKKGEWYFSIDDFKPEKKEEPRVSKEMENFAAQSGALDDDLPF